MAFIQWNGGVTLWATSHNFHSLVSWNSKGGLVHSSINAVTPDRANQMTTSSIQFPLTKKAKGIDTHMPVHLTHPNSCPKNPAPDLWRKLAKMRAGPSSLVNKNATRQLANAAIRNRK
jgi:hypothetical protein